jgi:hypothetical protein
MAEDFEARLAAIEIRLKKLERSQPSASTGGDPEYFDQPRQLEALAQTVEAMIRVVEERVPDFRKRVEEEHNTIEMTEAAALENRFESALGDQGN